MPTYPAYQAAGGPAPGGWIDDLQAYIDSPYVFNVETKFGAVPDTYFNDGVSNSTTTFTSATANFSGADVGKWITILRAGAGSAPTNQAWTTTIASVTNSTTVVLTSATKNSQNPCYFYMGTDQTTALQNAIDAAFAAGGGEVFLPGIGYAHSGLVLKHRVAIRGAGKRQTMLRLIGSANKPCIRNDYAGKAAFCAVRDLMLVGNRANQTEFTGTLGAQYTAGASTVTVGTGQGASMLPFGLIEMSVSKTVTGAVNNGSGLIRLTVTGHGYATGEVVDVASVGGVTNATGVWRIIVIDANTIDLEGTTFSGTYTTGGTANRKTRLQYKSISGDVLTLMSPKPAEGTTDITFANGTAFTHPNCHGIYFYRDPPQTDDANTLSEVFDTRHVVENVHMLDVRSDGLIWYGQINFIADKVDIFICGGVGIRTSYDSILSNVIVAQPGRMGILFQQANTHITNALVYNAGDGQRPPEGYGYFWDFTPPATDSEGMSTTVNCVAQDNSAWGFYIHASDRAIIKGCSASSNGKCGPVGRYAGVRLDGAQDSEIDCASVERRVDGSNSWQQNALDIDSLSVGNIIHMTHGAAGSATIGAPLRPGSVIEASNLINLGGSEQPIKVADQTVTNSAVLTDDTALQVYLSASLKYRIWGVIYFDTTAAGDFQYGFSGPTSPTLVRMTRTHCIAGGTPAEVGILDTALPSPVALVGTGTTGGYIRFDCIIHNSTNAGAFKFRFAQNTQTNDTGAIVRAGSWMSAALAVGGT